MSGLSKHRGAKSSAFWPLKFQWLWCFPYLVGGIPTPLKNMSSSVGMMISNIWKK